MSVNERIAARMMECSHRRREGCGQVDLALGWRHAMTMNECDKCWEMGSAVDSATLYRAQYAALTVSAIKRRGLANYLPQVGEQVILRHSQENERDMLRSQLIEARARHAERPIIRWLWIDWEGVPMPQRPFRAIWAGLIAVAYAPSAALNAWRSMRASGCGCSTKLKALVKGTDAARTDVPRPV